MLEKGDSFRNWNLMSTKATTLTTKSHKAAFCSSVGQVSSKTVYCANTLPFNCQSAFSFKHPAPSVTAISVISRSFFWKAQLTSARIIQHVNHVSIIYHHSNLCADYDDCQNEMQSATEYLVQVVPHY